MRYNRTTGNHMSSHSVIDFIMSRKQCLLTDDYPSVVDWYHAFCSVEDQNIDIFLKPYSILLDAYCKMLFHEDLGIEYTIRVDKSGNILVSAQSYFKHER